METSDPKSRAVLDPDAWLRLATEMLAEEGLAGLRVEVLAKRLNVTKGSFYWHFKDRQALLDALVDGWREGRIRDITKLTNVSVAQAPEQIRRVIDLYSIQPNRKGMMIELAMRDWARRDPRVAEAVEAVDQARLASAAALFVKAGFSEEEAGTRALLLYTHAFGLSMMVYDHFEVEIAAQHERISRMILKASETPG
jgi:AcrR family transcriptional regulator